MELSSENSYSRVKRSNPNSDEEEGNQEQREQPTSNKRQRCNEGLRIEIPTQDSEELEDHISSSFSSPNSLFDSPVNVVAKESDELTRGVPALRTAPPIPGLFFNPDVLLQEEFALEVMEFCMKRYFSDSNVNQVMLFERRGRTSSAQIAGTETAVSQSGLPPILWRLLASLEEVLRPILPPSSHSLLFPTPERPSSNTDRARQAIINLYQPGEGISPHVDLLKRFGDGIVGVSLGSGCVMQFSPVSTQEGKDSQKRGWDLFLPERSIIILSEDARYYWTHGIGKHTEDLVSVPVKGPDEERWVGSEGEWIERDVRLSITFRWLLPGADVVGDDD
jgi:hypothetical protein